MRVNSQAFLNSLLRIQTDPMDRTGKIDPSDGKNLELCNVVAEIETTAFQDAGSLQLQGGVGRSGLGSDLR
jgi:hypothetical protein